MTQLVFCTYDELIAGVEVAHCRDGTLAIGNFDGLHCGHRALLGSMQNHCAVDGRGKSFPKPWVALTFEPHPRSFFAMRNNEQIVNFRLSTPEQKCRWLGESHLGIDRLLVLRFDEQLAGMRARDFVRRILIASLGVRDLIVGEDFAFGYRREGTLATLQEISKEVAASSDNSASFTVHAFPMLTTESLDSLNALNNKGVNEKRKYASSYARQLLRAGRLSELREILGRNFEIEGIVQKGKGLGSKLGFPTANILPRDYCYPRFGVYCVRVQHIGNGSAGKVYNAVASFGERPTLGAGLEPLLEVHFFDYKDDLYGTKLRVEFEEFQRAEQDFSSLEELRLHIEKDVLQAQDYFSKNPFPASRRENTKRELLSADL